MDVKQLRDFFQNKLSSHMGKMISIENKLLFEYIEVNQHDTALELMKQCKTTGLLENSKFQSYKS